MNKVTDAKKSYILERNNFFINSVAKKYLVTSVLSMIFLYAGSFIDTLIVGMFLGENGLSAMSLVSPVFLIYYTIGATLGLGANILASRILGTGKFKEYRKVFSCATYILAGMAVLMILMSYVFIDPLSRFLCAGNTDKNILALVKQYLIYYIPGGGLTLVSYIPMYFLKTEGKPKLSSRFFSLSALLNVVLSWLFMSPVFDMGIGGASLATSISMAVVTLLAFMSLLKNSSELYFVKDCMHFAIIKDIIIAGIPNGLTNLLESAQIWLVNMLLIVTGFANLLPCYTVIRNIMGLQNSIIIGMSSAILPLIGVFFGERDYDSERQVMRTSKKVGVGVMIPIVILFSLLAGVLFRIFGVSDAEIIKEGRLALPLACAGLIIGYINAFYTTYMTAIKREWTATFLVALRTFVMLGLFGIPLAFIFGSKGIWFSFSLCEVATLLVFLLIRKILRSENPNLDEYILDTSLERDGDISFSVKNDVGDIVSASEKCSKYCEQHDVDMKRCMRVSLAIEELLTFFVGNCFDSDDSKYIDVRVCKLGEEVMIRFRYVGKIFDPLSFYKENSDNTEMSEKLLGLKMVFESASIVDFRQTFGANNLMMIF